MINWNKKLKSDVVSVINTIWKEVESPQIVLVGHSMGGAIAVHAAASGGIKNLAGLCVIDVVEGRFIFSVYLFSCILFMTTSILSRKCIGCSQ